MNHTQSGYTKKPRQGLRLLSLWLTLCMILTCFANPAIGYGAEIDQEMVPVSDPIEISSDDRIRSDTSDETDESSMQWADESSSEWSDESSTEWADELFSDSLADEPEGDLEDDLPDEWLIDEAFEKEALTEGFEELLLTEDLSDTGDDLFEEPGLILEDGETGNGEPETEISGEGHCLAFASDLHGTAGTLEQAMRLFPHTTEYVSLIGDLVGGRGNMKPAYNVTDVFDRISAVFPGISPANTSILWASHDENVQDELGIVRCPDGGNSGLIYTGYNSDGSVAYYIYGIGFHDMCAGGNVSQSAAQQFKDRVKGLNPNIPIIVLCHVPLEAKRGDNYGASYWNEALNYAATGIEGITAQDPETDYAVIRNVVYLYGHNHTVDQTEYLYRPGTSMNVQIDSSAEAGENNAERMPRIDPGTDPSTIPPPDTRIIFRGEGITSDIYYTACIPGYLKTSGNALLLRITSGQISLEKYNDGQPVSLGTDGATGEVVASKFALSRVRYNTPQYQWSDDHTMVTAKMQNLRTGNVITETVRPAIKVAKQAACEEPGELTYTAGFAQALFQSQTASAIIPATGHSFSGWTMTLAPTALLEGAYERTCSRCGLTQSETIPKLRARVTLKKKKLSLKEGKKKRLKIKTRTKGDAIEKWTSSNKKVATVSKKGTVTAHKKGKCTITVWMKSGAKAKCKVTVK